MGPAGLFGASRAPPRLRSAHRGWTVWSRRWSRTVGCWRNCCRSPPDVGYHLPEATYLAARFEHTGFGDDPAAVLLERGNVALTVGVLWGGRSRGPPQPRNISGGPHRGGGTDGGSYGVTVHGVRTRRRRPVHSEPGAFAVYRLLPVDQRTKDVPQDASVAVVLGFTRRVDAHDRVELGGFTVGLGRRDLDRLGMPSLNAVTPLMSKVRCRQAEACRRTVRRRTAGGAHPYQ